MHNQPCWTVGPGALLLPNRKARCSNPHSRTFSSAITKNFPTWQLLVCVSVKAAQMLWLKLDGLNCYLWIYFLDVLRSLSRSVELPAPGICIPYTSQARFLVKQNRHRRSQLKQSLRCFFLPEQIQQLNDQFLCNSSIKDHQSLFRSPCGGHPTKESLACNNHICRSRNYINIHLDKKLYIVLKNVAGIMWPSHSIPRWCAYDL